MTPAGDGGAPYRRSQHGEREVHVLHAAERRGERIVNMRVIQGEH